MSKKTSYEAPGDRAELVVCDQVVDDIVVVARVKRDIVVRLADGPNDIEGAVSVEGGDFDSEHIGDFCEIPPEFVWERPSSHGWLEIESDDWDLLRDGVAVFEHLVDRSISPCRHAEQSSMVVVFNGDPGFVQSLRSPSANPADPEDFLASVPFPLVDVLGDVFQDRLEKIELRRPNFKLSRMDGDGNSASSGVDVVSAQCPLMDPIDAAVLVER